MCSTAGLNHIHEMSYHTQRISIFKKHRQGVKPCQAHDMAKKILRHSILSNGRRGGLMVSALVPGSSGPGSSPGRGRCVVFLGKKLNSHSTSLHPGV